MLWGADGREGLWGTGRATLRWEPERRGVHLDAGPGTTRSPWRGGRTGDGHSLLALVQHEGPGVVVPRHGDHRLPLESTQATLVHGVAGDGGGGVAGPVQRVPAAVVRQPLHRAHICRRGGQTRVTASPCSCGAAQLSPHSQSCPLGALGRHFFGSLKLLLTVTSPKVPQRLWLFANTVPGRQHPRGLGWAGLVSVLTGESRPQESFRASWAGLCSQPG